ncbi:MAG: phosphatidate cytidylyltransferase [Rickettsiales bacterium]|jgi:phosphatidate cytidylyltransferase|nr:phosphatidate cytidylyltransferase [Rickettsiales bacterium]
MREGLLRVLSGIVLGAIVLDFVYCNSIFFCFVFIFILGILMAFEWGNIVKGAKNPPRWYWLGVTYIGGSLLPILFLKFSRFKGNHLLMWLFILLWSTDTFAYVVGYQLNMGRHRISSVSPGKSYEGLLGGMLFAIIFCCIFAHLYLPEYEYLLLYCTPLFCCLEQAGDFTESYIKRKFAVKDSGNMIPGHGGFMDRFDGLLYVTPLLLFLI